MKQSKKKGGEQKFVFRYKVINLNIRYGLSENLWVWVWKMKIFCQSVFGYFVCCMFFVVFVIDFMCFYGLLKMSIIGLCIKVG